MSKKTTHDAPGQMLGYLFQIERAVFWLSELKSGGLVGIECGDDLVVKEVVKGGITTYEQDKSSITQNAPYTDLSKDLWNTLNIWLKKISQESLDIKNCDFLMVTNRKIPSGRLVLKIHKATNDEDLNECLYLLKETGRKHNGKLKPTIEAVLKHSDNEIKSLLKKIKVFDSSYGGDKMFKDGIRKNMKISVDIPFDNIYQQFLGWAFEQTVLAWNNNQESWLQADAFISLSNHLITHYTGKPFIEKAIENLPVSKKDVLAVQKENFVKQLEKIGADEHEKIDAINNYLRASSEKTRFAKEANVTLQDWKLFENNLHERWTMIFNPTCKLSTELNDVQKGYKYIMKH